MDEILLIDDDLELCGLLSEYLANEGIRTVAAHTAGDGVRQALRADCRFVILDVMLPGGSGFDVLRMIRKSSRVPVLMLTARGEEIDRIVGLEMGADDYLAKPFNPRELLARIRAIQRRLDLRVTDVEKGGIPGPVILGDLRLDPGARNVSKNGRPVIVTAVEFTLLYELMRRAGQVVAREDLAVKVLGRRLSLFDRSIDVHVSSLRRKLGRELGGIERIKAIRGVGYLYVCYADAGRQELG